MSCENEKNELEKEINVNEWGFLNVKEADEGKNEGGEG